MQDRLLVWLAVAALYYPWSGPPPNRLLCKVTQGKVEEWEKVLQMLLLPLIGLIS